MKWLDWLIFAVFVVSLGGLALTIQRTNAAASRLAVDLVQLGGQISDAAANVAADHREIAELRVRLAAIENDVRRDEGAIRALASVAPVQAIRDRAQAAKTAPRESRCDSLESAMVAACSPYSDHGQDCHIASEAWRAACPNLGGYQSP